MYDRVSPVSRIPVSKKCVPYGQASLNFGDQPTSASCFGNTIEREAQLLGSFLFLYVYASFLVDSCGVCKALVGKRQESLMKDKGKRNKMSVRKSCW